MESSNLACQLSQWLALLAMYCAQVVAAQATAAPTASNTDAEDEMYWRQVKAIIGGVIGFWGGVGSMGSLFLGAVLTQRYCCRKDDDKDDPEG
jgi:hypothetical protein